MTNSSKPTRRSDIFVEENTDEAMLYHPDSDELHVLNPTAQFVWNLCTGEHSITEIEETLRTTFQVATDVDIHADVAQILTNFHEKQLLLSSD